MADKPDKSKHPSRDFQIHATGAFCEPLRFQHKNGEISWRWVVTEFTNDSPRQGEVVLPKERADISEELLEFLPDNGE